MRRFQLSLAVLAALSAIATPAAAASITVATSVNINKPVLLSKLQDMDFGTLTLSGFTGTRTITVSQAGALTCATNIVCSGVAKQARFNVQGSNNNTVLFTYGGGTLSNGIAGSETIPFTANGPASMAITNSGAPGTNFDVGGSLTITSTLAGGTYTGTMTVTADYQ
jgi:spore coat protein U-like protein